MIQQIQIEYTTKRCYTCGTYWAIEKARGILGTDVCPGCAARDIQRANERADIAERSRNALKGAFLRLKRSIL